MYAIILCEGETDAILISYYLINTLGYGYIKRLPNNMPKLDDLVCFKNSHLMFKNPWKEQKTTPSCAA